MNNRVNLIILAGFILTLAGRFMKIQDVEFGNFVAGFGSGVLATGIVLFIYGLIQKRNAKRTT